MELVVDTAPPLEMCTTTRVGCTVGLPVGDRLGTAVVGADVGVNVGYAVGAADGDRVGSGVGSRVVPVVVTEVGLVGGSGSRGRLRDAHAARVQRERPAGDASVTSDEASRESPEDDRDGVEGRMRGSSGAVRGAGHERLTLGVTLLGDVDAMIGRGVHDDWRLGIEVPGWMGEGGDASSDGRVLAGKECWLDLQNLGVPQAEGARRVNDRAR